MSGNRGDDNSNDKDEFVDRSTVGMMGVAVAEIAVGFADMALSTSGNSSGPIIVGAGVATLIGAIATANNKDDSNGNRHHLSRAAFPRMGVAFAPYRPDRVAGMRRVSRDRHFG